jgi:hypothetical protein
MARAISLSAAAVCASARAVRTFCSASSRARSAAFTMLTAEPPSTVWAPWCRSASCTAHSRYSSQSLSVHRASTRASYWPRYQSSSVLN